MHPLPPLTARPPYDADDDEALTARAAEGDLPAFEALVSRHGAAILSALARLGLDPHTAEDAAQEVWVKFHTALTRYRPGALLRPWLFSIVVNQGRDTLRRNAARPTTTAAALAEAPAPSQSHSHPDDSLPERDAIQHALAQVAAPFREALVLVDVMGLDYAEAAAALDCALGTVKSRVSRARDSFRAAYQRAAHSSASRRNA